MLNFISRLPKKLTKKTSIPDIDMSPEEKQHQKCKTFYENFLLTKFPLIDRGFLEKVAEEFANNEYAKQHWINRHVNPLPSSQEKRDEHDKILEKFNEFHDQKIRDISMHHSAYSHNINLVTSTEQGKKMYIDHVIRKTKSGEVI